MQMKPMVTDNPAGNFETVLNYVYDKDGEAYIRVTEEGCMLTEWIRRQCISSGCEAMELATTSADVDETICDCAFDNPDCLLFILYVCACQAVHLRSRLKRYESSGIMPDELEGKVISRFGTAKCLACGHVMDLMDLVSRKKEANETDPV